MALTPMVRRALLAIGGICLIIVFLWPSTKTDAAPAAVTAASGGSNQADGGPSRSYPIPPSSDTKKQKEQQKIQEVKSRPLRERIDYHFPYDIQSKFPAYIWQTWRASPATGDFEDRLRPFEASWTVKHPGFVHEVITDEAAFHLVNYLFASIPEVIEAYEAMPMPVIKADFFRYLILLARGGIYTDIDTTALKPAMEWLPADFDRSTAGLLVGIEADPDREDWAKWYSRRIQFCQWTIQSKPGHPVLRDIVATITEDTLDMKSKKQLKKGKAPTVKSIVEFTGPAVWTDAVFSYFNNEDYFDFSVRSANITYQDFFAMKEPKQVGDVVVLPLTSFSPGVRQMGAGETDDKWAFVKHDFDGSWKPDDEKVKGN